MPPLLDLTGRRAERGVSLPVGPQGIERVAEEVRVREGPELGGVGPGEEREDDQAEGRQGAATRLEGGLEA
jgi:hypothetical protein